MEGKKILKRLYVGGLGHTVSEGELQERFSKFGEVTDVEILTRKDEQGNNFTYPIKYNYSLPHLVMENIAAISKLLFLQKNTYRMYVSI